MFWKILLGAAGLVAGLWVAGYDPATIKRNALELSSRTSSPIATDGDDWGSGSH